MVQMVLISTGLTQGLNEQKVYLVINYYLLVVTGKWKSIKAGLSGVLAFAYDSVAVHFSRKGAVFHLQCGHIEIKRSRQN